MKHPYHDRTSTNAKVFENATIEAYRKAPPEVVARSANRDIHKKSDMYKRQKTSYLDMYLEHKTQIQ